MVIWIIISTVVGLAAIVLALVLTSWVKKQDAGNETMKEIAGFIRDGAIAFLKEEYRYMLIVLGLLFIAIIIGINLLTAALFLFGALLSVLAGAIGMNVATLGNVRTASAAQREGMGSALKIAFRSGAVMGLCVAGLGLFGIGASLILLGL